MLRLTTFAALLITLAACETIQGAGRDIQDGGQALESEIEG